MNSHVSRARPRPPTTVPMEADDLAASTRVTPSAQPDGDACDKTVTPGLARTRGNAKSSYSQLTYQN